MAQAALDMMIPKSSRDRPGYRPFASMHRVYLPLGPPHDGVHDPHSGDGMIADGGFRAEHDGVRAVEHGVSHIARLGSRRPRVMDHGFEHLRRGDDRLVVGVASSDDHLLEDGNILRGHLDSKVASGDHDGIRSRDDVFDILDRLRLLDLGDDGDA
jgi:hypothetical protein